MHDDDEKVKNSILHQLFTCFERTGGSEVIRHLRPGDDFGQQLLIGS